MARPTLIKLFSALIFLSPYFASKAQKNTYNTHVDTARKVIVNAGRTTILKADSVFIGQVIINEAIPTQVYFLGSTTTLDTNKIYTTTFKFAPKVNPGTFNVNITIKFDKPFIPWYTTERPPPNAIVPGWTDHVIDIRGDNGVPQVSNGWSNNYYVLQVRGPVPADDIYISVKSKERLYATITGAIR